MGFTSIGKNKKVQGPHRLRQQCGYLAQTRQIIVLGLR